MLLATALFLVYVCNVDVMTPLLRVSGRALSMLPSVSTPFGRVHIESRSTKQQVTLDIQCVACEVNSKHIGDTPFTSTTARLIGTYQKNHFSGVFLDTDVKVNLESSWKDGSASGKFSLAETRVEALYRVFSSIVPEVEDATITGTLSGTGTFRWPDAYLAFKPTVKNFTVDGLIDADDYKEGSFDYQGKNANDEIVTYSSGDDTDGWIPLSQAGEFLTKAIIAAEDRGFMTHPGYDLAAMHAASTDNRKAGKLKRGGSTLSQQLAKNLFLSPNRTYARKLRELLYSVEMERELGKRRILELYINIVEWGPDIRGAKAAAQTYFGKEVKALLPEEAAWLANIIRSPKLAYKREFLPRKPNLGQVENVLSHMEIDSDTRRKAYDRLPQLRFVP